MLTKGAIGNLVNRYKAVLAKCNLINTFGSLAVASMLVLGGAGVAEATQYIEGFGKPVAVEKADITVDGLSDKARVLGGWYITSAPSDAQKAALNTSITINGGVLNKADGNQTGFVFGGHYVSDLTANSSDKTVHAFNTGTTNIVINDVEVEYVIGGTGMHNSNVEFKGAGTSICITGGIFGKGTPDGNVPEQYVTGGDTLKQGGYAAYVSSATSTLEKTSIAISGGKFDAAIIGGSNVIEYYRAGAGEMSAQVGTASIDIRGGEFNHAIIGGGLTWGGGDSETHHFPEYKGVISNVDKVVMNIDGSSGKLAIKGDIYAGGLQGSGNNPELYNKNTVGEAKVTIANAEVNSVYGCGAELKQAASTPGVWGQWQYSPLTAKTVKTALTMANSSANEVFVPGGESSVTLRSENAGKVSIKTLTVQNADKVTISADGQTNDKLDGNASQLTGIISAEKIVYLDAPEAESNDLFAGKEVVMEAGEVTGEVTATFDENGKLAKQTEKPNETNVAMADLPTINLMLTRVEMNDLRKRMGDIRLLEGNTGVWARWDGGKLKGDSGLTNDFHKIQIGADTATGIDSLRLGAAFSYTNSDMDFAKANAESDTLSFAGYGVWTADNGMFADVIARLAFVDTEVETDKVKGDLNNLALSLSGEFGWRFDVCDQFFVEPQVELTYTYINSDDFKYNGTKFDFEDSDSLIGRAGLAAGWKLPNDLGDLYARASVVQEFLGDGKLTVSKGSTVRYNETDGNDTWLEYGIGANVKVSKNAYIFADVERTEGAELDEEWRGTVGIRYSF